MRAALTGEKEARVTAELVAEANAAEREAALAAQLEERDVRLRSAEQALAERHREFAQLAQLVVIRETERDDEARQGAQRRAEIDTLKHQIAALQAERDAQGSYIAELLASRSWNVTKPLRGVTTVVRRVLGYADPLVAPDQVRATIRHHPDFVAFRAQVTNILNGWTAANTPRLMAIKLGDHPRDLIYTIAEDMLTRFDPAPLVDKYEAYQRLMSYWAATMQDDVFIIAGGGWLTARDLREARKETSDDGKVKWLEEGDLTVNKVRLVADVIPPALITARFFPDLKAKLDQAAARAEELGREIEELAEEHGAEGGLLELALSDTGRPGKRSGDAFPEKPTTSWASHSGCPSASQAPEVARSVWGAPTAWL
ncbi:hypothetical protein D0Z66_17260 [Cereibacter sphaeroides]|nr:hypothetical protein D0Z66_17260 [Cereibacter sphaeroides]